MQILSINEITDESSHEVNGFDKVVVNSNGGSIDGALALASAIDVAKLPIVCNANTSSAATILLACRDVIVGPQAWGFVHAPSTMRELGTNPGLDESWLKSCEQLWEAQLPVLQAASGYSPDELFLGKYLYAEQLRYLANSRAWRDAMFGAIDA